MHTHTIRGALFVATALSLSALGGTSFAQTTAGTATAPQAVLNTFRQTYPGATITRTSQERDANRPVIRIESVDKGRQRVVLYGDSNAVVEVADQVDEKELPQPVSAAMHSHPKAIFVTAMKIMRGGSVQYHLTLKGTRKTSMLVKPDGTVVDFH